MQGLSLAQALLVGRCNGPRPVCSSRSHCKRIGPCRVGSPARSIHRGCVVAVPRRLEKSRKYPRVRCRGEGFSAPPITSGCSQALFQRGCSSGRALGLLAGGIQSPLGGFGSGSSSARWRQLWSEERAAGRAQRVLLLQSGGTSLCRIPVDKNVSVKVP